MVVVHLASFPSSLRDHLVTGTVYGQNASAKAEHEEETMPRERREKRLRISDFIIVLSCFIYFGWRVPLDTAGYSEKREVATPGTVDRFGVDMVL